MRIHDGTTAVYSRILPHFCTKLCIENDGLDLLRIELMKMSCHISCLIFSRAQISTGVYTGVYNMVWPVCKYILEVFNVTWEKIC